MQSLYEQEEYIREMRFVAEQAEQRARYLLELRTDAPRRSMRASLAQLLVAAGTRLDRSVMDDFSPRQSTA